MSQDPGNLHEAAVNPYAVDQSRAAGGPPPGGRGMINQVVPLGVCLIIHGVLTILMGIFYAAFVFLFPQFAGPQPNAPQMPANFMQIMQAAYVGIALAMFAAGGMHVLAGIKVLRYEGRTLTIVALTIGFLNFFGCYCFPTAIGLFVWGLIVLLNDPVQQAFRLRAEGYRKDEIDRML